MRTKINILFAFMLMCISAVSAQNVRITGEVKDQAGDPLIGVSVVIKGTSRGVVTDIDGKYAIDAPQQSTLVFSFIGFNPKEIKVGSKTIINVVLEESVALLDECVVVGYGVQQKSMVTGSVSSVSGKKPKKDKSKNVPPPPMRAASPSAGYYMAEMIPGIQVTQADRAYVTPAAYGSEEYGGYKENRFISPLSEALSTFSIDVDTESYTNFRRFINQGQKPSKDAIRIEEFINYFKYNYDEPTKADPVKVTTEVGECPWDSQNRLVRIGVKAKEIAKEDLPSSNLVFLIDVSGSMSGATRLELVKSSMKMLVNTLRDNDRVAIVVYASEVGEKLASTPGSDKQTIKNAIDALSAYGSTNGAGGIQKAYEIAEKNFIKGGNNRIILCSDGDFNVGASSPQALEEMIEQKRQSGVFLSVLGYGMGNYKSNRMQVLAEKGNGNAFYIDNIQEANRVLVQEFSGTLYTIAKDVKLQLEFNPANVQAYRLVGYESRLLAKEDFNDDTKDAGEMGVGHTVTALYEIIPVGVKSNMYGKVDDLKYQAPAKPLSNMDLTDSPELLTVKLRYKQPDGDKSVKMELPVVDNGKNEVSSDMRFASAVAMFGQLLKGSEFKGNATYQKAIDLARSGISNDKDGYKAEFVRLAEAVKNMN